MEAKMLSMTANVGYDRDGNFTKSFPTSHEYEILFDNGVTVKFTGPIKNIITGKEPIEDCIELLKQIING